ncbi:MAG TPA: hypothetical protein ENK02_09185 [Planctomycetes bacterium]|nr:hypothetical protein [Planctomycetota bacterium]
MPERIIDKRTLKLLKDAVVHTKDHLRKYYSEVQAGKCEEPLGLARQFGQVQRLHRYFSNLAELGSRTFPMQLGEEEANLLASCLVHYLPNLDQEVAKPDQPPSQVEFLKEIQKDLVRLVKSLMTRPIQPILDQGPLASQSPSVRALLGFIPGQEEKAKKIDAFQPKTMGMFSGSAIVNGPNPALGGKDKENQRMEATNLGQGIVGGRRKSDREALEKLSQGKGRPSPLEGILDPSMIKDHRMRALIKLELACLERSSLVGDFRMQLVHFGAILEGILVDYGLRNRKKLELIESPDRWDLMRIAEDLLGEKAFDEPIVGILLGCNRLLRPARMLVNPMIITKEMVEDAQTILSWILSEMGLKGSSDQTADLDPKGCHEPPATSGIWRATRRS